MHIAAENSERDLRERDILCRLEPALRHLTANLMRISRGAGKPAEIVVQAVEVVSIVREYEELTGHGVPVETVSELLSVRHPYEWTMKFGDEERERLRATEQMIAGALQVAASRLVDQKTQERLGDNELYQGVSRLQVLQEEMRKQRQAAARAARPKVAKRRKKDSGSVPKIPI